MPLTTEQLEWLKNPYGDNDEAHTFHILLPLKHFPEWFAAKHTTAEVEDDYELDYEDAQFDFEKYDDETIQVIHPVPTFWTEVDREELEEAILKKLYLKREWIVEMTCDG